MRKTLLLLILVIQNSFCQNSLNGIIVDKDTKNPIEYVDIFNSTNFTSTNSEGKFLFTSEQDSIKIRLLGYQPISSTFENIKNDTIFLKSKFVTLDEIIIGNSSALKNVFKEIENNYPANPYSESFFLRCLLKKDGEIVKLQDLNGLVERKKLFSTSKNSIPKKNYKVELLNMRKAGIKDKIDGRNVSVSLFSFKQILDFTSSIKINNKSYNFRETNSENSEYTKYHYSPKEEDKLFTEGFYLINNKDKAIVEFKLKNNTPQVLFTETKGIKYRTTSFELFTSFKKNIVLDKYFIDKAKIKAQLEVKVENERVLYDIEYSWITLNQTKKEVDKNISVKKDIFKLKKAFDPKFWEEQEYLLLTNEMTIFLKKLENSQKEFKTETNIK